MPARTKSKPAPVISSPPPAPRIVAILIEIAAWGGCLGLLYAFKGPISQALPNILQQVAPCSRPIPYSIGAFDTRFGISQKDFMSAIQQAEAIWEKPSGKDLFEAVDGGALKINLVYDNRQAATQRLQKAGVSLQEDQAGYDALKARYQSQNAIYLSRKKTFDAMVAAYTADRQAYDAEIAQAQRKGGVTQEEYDRLEAHRQSLNAQVDKIDQAQTELNASVANVNDLAAAMNRLATALNLKVDTYNTISGSNGEEFEEGVYQSDGRSSEIDIYQYDNRQKLVRVLAHELGHALGLDHVEDPQAIMYRLNRGTRGSVSDSDLAALKQRCGS